MAQLPPGVLGDSDLDVNQGQYDFMVALRYVTPPNVRIYITSATRTPERQASAMLYKFNANGAEELYKTYKADNIVTELIKSSPDVPTWAAILRKHAANGIFMSRHMRGDALDIRIRDISSADANAIKAAASSLGASTLLEDVPPHLHVDNFQNAKAALQRIIQQKQQQLADQSQAGAGENNTNNTNNTTNIKNKPQKFEFLRLSQMPKWAVGTLGASATLLLIAVAVRLRKRRAANTAQ